jgi:hypothetical protein
MIHFLTVHWNSEFWITSQARQIARCTRSPYRIYSFVSGIDLRKYQNVFYYSSDSQVKDHATKLNDLAQIACDAAEDPQDLLVFLDSDAFPIAPWEDFVREKLKSNALVAVRRDENLGDPQPHPCFCVTTVKLWKEIGGDWRAGYRWRNSEGRDITDVGGNLLLKLRSLALEWHPLTRSNVVNLHPLFFGIYGNLAYHHGAGSRRMSCRLETVRTKKEIEKDFRKFGKALHLDGFLLRMALRKNSKKNEIISSKIKEQLTVDPEFYRSV